MARPIKVIGIGPGSPAYLLPAAQQATAQCQALLGSARALSLFDIRDKETQILDGDLAAGLAFLLQWRMTCQVGVLVGGDPGFHSMLGYLRRHLPATALEVIPGISSLQVAFARLALPWQEARLLSLHGRSLGKIAPDLAVGTSHGLLLDGRLTGRELAAQLQPYGEFTVHLCRNLTYPDEEILSLTLPELAQQTNLGNAVAVIETNEKK